MELQCGPNSVDQPHLLYKLQRKIKVFNTSNSLPNRGYNLVASCSKYGLVFIVAPNSTLSVYHLRDLIDKECEPQHVTLKLQVEPTHIAVNCDQEWLAVISKTMLFVYKIVDFQNQNTLPSFSIKLDVNPSTFVSAVQWNPCIPETIAIAFHDGTLLVSQVNSMQVKKLQSGARCICWSPKGKQLVTGNSDGTLCQYKPDLSPMKTVPAPNLFESAAVEALAIHWISTYQFAVVYRNATNNSRPAVTIVNTPKGGHPSCVNYEDICYSMGTNRPWYYYLHGIAQWNLILASSSNSMEIATLGSTDGANWLQWCQTDEARPELPITDRRQENYPVGLCIDTCAIHQLPWGENETLPPMPLLHVLSQTGLLSIFNVINLNQGATNICSPPQQLTLPAAVMTSAIPDDVVQVAPVSQPTPQVPAQSQFTPAQPQQVPVQKQQVPTQQQQVTAQEHVPAQQQYVPSQQQQIPVQQQYVPSQQQQIPAQQQYVPSQQQQIPAQQQYVTPQQQQIPAQQQYVPSQQQQIPAQQQYVTPQQQVPVQQQYVSVQQQQVPVQQQRVPVPPASMSTFSQSFANPNTQAFGAQQAQATQGIFAAPTPQTTERKQTEVKPQISVPPTATTTSTPKPAAVEAPKAQSPIQTQEINAALKSEQERVNKMKANEELKNMLIKEVNDFQMELYKFKVMTQEMYVKVKQDLESIGSDFTVHSKDIEQIKKECSVEELRESIVQLKLELVRACAVVAEARTYAETKDLHQWSQADPLTIKRVASVKKLAYYVQNQLDQAYKALDHKWNEMAIKNLNEKPGQRMMRPILDDIYQPLVKQQEILSRQQAVLRTLRNVLKECGDISPVFKSTSILRSTPFRNKADPLSKLTKNILNMSIEPAKDKGKEPSLSNQKLDALRDMLSDHKTVKIKPVNVELRQRLAAMRLNYERSMKEKAAKEEDSAMKKEVKIEPESPKVESSLMNAVKPDVMKAEPKMENKTQPIITIPSYTPISNEKAIKPAVNNVVRTLFTDEAQSETEKYPLSQQQSALTLAPNKSEEPKSSSGINTVTSTTRTLLKVMLHNKSQSQAETKNDANTFMGQNICSPTAFSTSKTSTTIAAPSAVFTSKPIADINNMFNKLQTQTFTPVNVKSSETGEPESAAAPNKTLDKKPQTNIFTLKPSTPLTMAESQNVPDVLKSTAQAFAISKTDTNIKTDVKAKETMKLKENIPEKENTSKDPQKLVDDKKDNEVKPLSLTNKSSLPVVSTSQVVFSTDPKKGVEVKPEITISKTVVIEKPAITLSESSNNTAAASKPQTIFETPAAQVTSVSTPSTTGSTSNQTSEAITAQSASSIFGSAVASQKTSAAPDTKPSSPTGSIFATSPNSTSSLFGTSSIFGKSTSASATESGTAQAKSIFSSAVSSTPFVTPTTSDSVTVDLKTTTTEPSSLSSSTTSTPAFTTSTTSSIFSSETKQPVFDTPTTSTPSVTTQSLFEQPSTTQSIFAPTSTTQSVFSTTPTPVFGSAPTTAQSVFAAATVTTTSSMWTSSTQNGIFQSGNQQPIFGGASTQSSIFGTSASPTQSGSIFGTPTASTQSGSIFGTPTQTTQSVFGTATTPTTQTSVFETPTTAQSSSLFGGAESNLFAAATISTTKAPSSPTSGGNIFGGSGTGTVFGGGGTNIFGGKASFGQSNQSPASIFGGANSTFKQNTSTNLWGGGTTTGGNVFSSGFGQQATTQASMFGGSTGGSFSAPSTGQPLGSPQGGAFSGGDAKPSQTIFGSPQQQTSSAFGGSAVFGSKPVFGQTASFGSTTSGFGSFGGFNKSPGGGFGAPATFGGAPAFGSPGFGNTSPGKAFGGSSPAPSFGAPTQSNATFENLATQNTLTFGNLAQQSGQQSPQQSAFNTSPSFTGWRG